MKKLLLASSIAALSAGPLSVQADEGTVYINPAIGYQFFDSARKLDDSSVFALGLEYQIDEQWGVEVLGLRTSPEHEQLRDDIDISAYRIDGLYYFAKNNNLKPYLAAGVGKADFDFDFVDYDENQFNFGGGVRYLIDDRFSTRADFRFVTGDMGDENALDTILTLGISYAFGTAPKASAAEPAVVVDSAPADSDNDGVNDQLDQCSGTPASVKVNAQGCPLDDDNDGVANYKDVCPSTPDNLKVNAQGCPVDTDGDLVPDYKDQCASTPAGVGVDGNGCPLDLDGDKVLDYMDKCPGSAAGAVVDETGCKLEKPEVKEIKLEVHFPSNSSVVPASALSEIEKLAKVMKEYPAVTVEIEGHTDSTGKAQYNKYLSQKRANSVARVLTSSFGIDAKRVKAIGYGEEKPIADNNTRDGRLANRRVVAVLK